VSREKGQPVTLIWQRRAFQSFWRKRKTDLCISRNVKRFWIVFELLVNRTKPCPCYWIGLVILSCDHSVKAGICDSFFAVLCHCSLRYKHYCLYYVCIWYSLAHFWLKLNGISSKMNSKLNSHIMMVNHNHYHHHIIIIIYPATCLSANCI
jgi:hypothetical protein